MSSPIAKENLRWLETQVICLGSWPWEISLTAHVGCHGWTAIPLSMPAHFEISLLFPLSTVTLLMVGGQAGGAFMPWLPPSGLVTMVDQ